MTVEPKENSKVYTGKVTDVTFYTETFVADNLLTVITKTNLGKLDKATEQL